MLMYKVQKDTFEFSKKDINSNDDIIDAYVASFDNDAKPIFTTTDKAEAKAELAKYRSHAAFYSSPIGTLVAGEIYLLETYESNDKGDFLFGSDYDFAEFENDIFKDEDDDDDDDEDDDEG